jgi:hypothetical protein
MIGSLLYLTATRLDILFSVCLCARFQSDPRESHLTAVKRILKYLKGTPNLGLMYEKTSEYRLSGYCDADYAGDRMERKSTSGNCQLLEKNLISWASKKAINHSSVHYRSRIYFSITMHYSNSLDEESTRRSSNL